MEFYKVFPFDDLHRFHRPASVVAASNGVKYDKALKFLQPEPPGPPVPPPEGYTEVDVSMANAFGFKLKPRKRKE